MKINEETQKLLEILGFSDINELPTMKKLRANFIKLAIEKHPDKGGNNEDFKELYKAYKTLGNLITSEEISEESDNEEIEARRVFREENWEKVNSKSITIKVNSSEGDAWEEVLKKNFGNPQKNSLRSSENKGEKYTTIFTVDEEECNMYITVFKPSKELPEKRKILVQAERYKQSFNVPFVNITFPRLYREVKQLVETGTRKHNLRNQKKVSYGEDIRNNDMDISTDEEGILLSNSKEKTHTT